MPFLDGDFISRSTSVGRVSSCSLNLLALPDLDVLGYDRLLLLCTTHSGQMSALGTPSRSLPSFFCRGKNVRKIFVRSWNDSVAFLRRFTARRHFNPPPLGVSLCGAGVAPKFSLNLPPPQKKKMTGSVTAVLKNSIPERYF